MLTKLKNSFKKFVNKIREKLAINEENLIDVKTDELVNDLDTIVRCAIKIAGYTVILHTIVYCVDYLINLAYKLSGIFILLY